MKPSLYFKDCFRYSLKKFASKESLLRWFIKQAGETSEVFEYPMKLSANQTVLMILPESSEDVSHYIPFLQKLAHIKKSGVLLMANTLHENLLQTNRIQQEVLYYTTLGCRYGEDELQIEVIATRLMQIEKQQHQLTFQIEMRVLKVFFHYLIVINHITNKTFLD